MSEKDDVVFDADVYRRLEFLERRFNALVEETHDARADARGYAFASLFVFVVSCVFMFVLIPRYATKGVAIETPSFPPATVGELVKTLETAPPQTPLGKEGNRWRF